MTIDQFNQVDIHWTFHLTTTEYILLLIAGGTIIKLENIVGYKTNLNKFEMIQFLQIFYLTPTKFIRKQLRVSLEKSQIFGSQIMNVN